MAHLLRLARKSNSRVPRRIVGINRHSPLADGIKGVWRATRPQGRTWRDAGPYGAHGAFDSNLDPADWARSEYHGTGITFTSGENAGGVLVGDIEALDLTGSAFTLFARTVPSAISNFKYIMARGDNNASTAFVGLRFASSDWSFLFRTTGGLEALNTTATATAGARGDVVGTYDGTNARIYVNGALGGSSTHSGTLVSQMGYNLHLGNFTNGGSFSFPGFISEAGMVNRAWSAEEVRRWYLDQGELYDQGSIFYSLPASSAKTLRMIPLRTRVRRLVA